MRPWTAVPPQQGRRFVITGANSGVGFQAARILGSRGAELVLACRNLEKGEAAARQVPGYDAGRVVVRRLDVADLASVRAFAEAFLSEYDGLDVLVNNAGVLGAPYGLTPDGVETHFATNHLGHFALTNLLLPRVRDRVVVTSSREHRRGSDIDLDDLAWEGRPVQGVLGLCPVQARRPAVHVRAPAPAHRGRVRRCAPSAPTRAPRPPTSPAAPATRSSPGSATTGSGWSRMPAWRGALCTVYAATMDIPGDTYIGPHGRLELHGWPSAARRSCAAQDPALAQRLWEISEKLSGVTFPAAVTGSVDGGGLEGDLGLGRAVLRAHHRCHAGLGGTPRWRRWSPGRRSRTPCTPGRARSRRSR